MSKYKENAEGEFAPVYFNSATKAVTGPEDSFNRSFQEIFNGINNWISEGSSWVTESIDGEYINVSIYSPLSGSSCTELPVRNSKKGLINIKNDDNKCFRWCHTKILNRLKTHPERITKADRSLSSLEYGGIKFAVSKKDYGRIEKKSNIWINVFADENGLAYPVHVRDKKFEDCIYQGF